MHRQSQNVTNVATQNTTIPPLHQVGPYTFREEERKLNITWHDNGTVSYRRMKHWYFEPSMSVGPLTNTITTINVPVVGSAEFARGDFINEWGMSEMLATMQATVFVKKTIGELLFDGYDDIVMEIGNSFTESEYDDGGFGFEEEGEEEPEPDKAPMDRFGWFYKVCGRFPQMVSIHQQQFFFKTKSRYCYGQQSHAMHPIPRATPVCHAHFCPRRARDGRSQRLDSWYQDFPGLGAGLNLVRLKTLCLGKVLRRIPL